MTRALEQASFKAMGTICVAAATAEPNDVVHARRALDAAKREVEACERALSRFDTRSDLSQLNGAGGRWIEVDARLVDALAHALRARTETGGRFDPTILPALLAAGYDRSFELLRERTPASIDGWRAGARIDLDSDSRRARVERGAMVDLGGIGKGFAAMRALEAMRATWPRMTGALIDLGGDIAVWGTPSDDGPWRVDVADPRTSDHVATTLELSSGAVATSGRDTRRFGPGKHLHHLIDPTTGRPATAGPLSVTVVAPSAIDAEAHATGLAIVELDDARDHLASRPELAALFVPLHGEPVPIGPLPLADERPRTRIVITTQTGRLQWN